MDDDLHLLHMAINMNISMLTCEQIDLCSRLKSISNYEFFRNFSIEGILEASNMFKLVEKMSNDEYVLKLIPVNEFEQFIAIYLRTSDNRTINQIVDIIHEKQFVFVLFESAFDDLHSYLKERGRLGEHEILSLFNQIVNIVHTLDRRGVIIGDLKLRKFVFTDSNRTILKLENLDAATFEENGVTIGRRWNYYGCILYQAPEVLNNTKEQCVVDVQKATMWSLGVILYTLAFGKYPFHHSNLNILRDRISNGSFDSPQIHFSANFLNFFQPLVTSLLHKEPSKRPYTGEILANEWIGSNQIDQSKSHLKFPSSNHHMHCSNRGQMGSKEYYSQLSKLVKSTKVSIEKIIESDIDQIDYTSSLGIDSRLVDDIPVVYYRFNKLSANQTKQSSNTKYNELIDYKVQ